ncbi:MAG: hypothetical protein WBF42_18390 [Terracidiphilus sp.]
MNSHLEDSRAIEAGRQAEATLRLIAGLPAPGGLEDRVQQAVQQALIKAPPTARIVAWPLSRERWSRERWMQSSFTRGAAAAAIVLAVGGGGWGVYSHVHPPQAQRVIAMPLRVGAPGGFSNAGAMRTPQTLNRPVLTHPASEAAKPQSEAALPAAPHLQRKRNSATKRHPHAKTATAAVAVQQ